LDVTSPDRATAIPASRPDRSSRIPLIAAALTFLVHLVANPHYGYFRDELYFIVCGRHPALGYVDQPPLAPLIAAGTQIFGHSLVLLRAAAAVFAAASIYVTCILAAELGGGAFAQIFAALTSALCPVLCAFGMKISTDTVGLWLWPLTVLYLVRLARGAHPRLWLGVGAAVGVSVLSKYSVVYLVAAFAAAVVCTPQRRMLWSRWFIGGVALAAALALPNVAWQAAHGFPILEVLRNGQHGKNVLLSPAGYLLAELLITNPVLALTWIAGLAWLLAHAETRFVGLGFLFLLAAMIASHAKHYYPADIYPVLFAAGGVAVERATDARRWLRPVVTTVAAAAGLAAIPYVLPVLPVPVFLRYHGFVSSRLQLEATRTENARPTALPQDWADMHGWPELAAAVARVVESLPPGERERAAIVTANYGEAAAIDFFGERYHLPPVLSGHNQYFLWGTHGYDGEVVIDVNGDCGRRAQLFRSSEQAAFLTSPLVMPWENDVPIMVCRGIARPLPELWAGKKFYY
jgi:4-amino-4-deoxy-L-arabinose transferase-like glycosyltransferase